MEITPEVNAILISTVVAVGGAFATWMVAWLRVKTRLLNEMAERTKAMADANHDLLVKNTKLAEDIQRQTDGLMSKMLKISEAVAFTKGRVQGREEGESPEEYEELDKMEQTYQDIINADHTKKPKP